VVRRVSGDRRKQPTGAVADDEVPAWSEPADGRRIDDRERL
jgi:hypothetical protein